MTEMGVYHGKNKCYEGIQLVIQLEVKTVSSVFCLSITKS